ncbi:MAG: energy-coupling factor ABC transporter ATP-binding protein [Treponema sp.]|nr:energy-coupling factor ABC transporter ATP-binding protein [Treponema sp.]
MNLTARNLTFRYFENSRTNVLENFDFDLPEGKITVLTGKSGCGKSTLAYILAGLYPENGGFLVSGGVFYDGIDSSRLTADKRVSFVSMMFQNCDLQFCMNNLHNELLFCLENVKTPVERTEAVVAEVVSAIGIPHLLERNFNAMSGGEKQKCALCCILALKSKCIILDEAFANIDIESAREIILMLKNLGTTVLAIDHNVALWEGSCDHVVSMDGSGGRTEGKTMAVLDLVGNTVLATRNLTVNGIRYPDMSFERGSLTAILGPSGCGKTTFFKTVIGQHKYRGEIDFFGHPLSKTGRNEVFSKCGIVFQSPSSQFLALTVYDEILFSVNRWYKKENERAKEERTLELLRLFELERYKKYSPYLLSQGQQRRLAVLSMIAGNQELLLLDEPTYGQDYENIRAVMSLLLKRSLSGLTVIFSTHNETVARNFSHKSIRLEGNAHE